MLPLGLSNGIAFYVDGSKATNMERSDFQLGWCVKRTKAKKEHEVDATGEEPASKVASEQVKHKGKSGKKAKRTTQFQKQKEEPIATHVINWSPCTFKWTSESGNLFTFEIHKPSLCPNPLLEETSRIGVDLRRPPYAWDTDMIERLRCN